MSKQFVNSSLRDKQNKLQMSDTLDTIHILRTLSLMPKGFVCMCVCVCVCACVCVCYVCVCVCVCVHCGLPVPCHQNAVAI